MLFGIGVDDCFVIASAVDQTDPRDAIEVRMKEAMIHAGTSITITSLTNSIAFFLGCLTSLSGLRSFCFFAGVGVLCLYLASMTIFSAALVWDMRRQINQIGDCCGLCRCKEDSIICCRGRLLSQKQREYPYRGTLEEAQLAEMQNEVETEEHKYSYFCHWVLQEKYGRCLTSTICLVISVIFFLGLTFAACIQIQQLKIEFKQTYFVADDAYISSYFKKSDQYFKLGQTLNIYTDNAQTAYYTVDS